MTKRNQWLLPFITGAALVAGCSARERADRHEQRAREQVQSANEELRKGEERAERDRIDARKKANEDFRDAREERVKAEEALAGERHQVAGRDDVRDDRAETADHKPTSAWIDDVRDKLGADWTVERQPTGVLALRKHPARRDADFRKKLDGELNSLRDDQKGVDASVMGDEIKVRGTFDHCRKLAKWADKLADVSGVNRIFFDATCKD